MKILDSFYTDKFLQSLTNPRIAVNFFIENNIVYHAVEKRM